MENLGLNTAEDLALLQVFGSPSVPEEESVFGPRSFLWVCEWALGLGEDALVQLARGGSWTGCSSRLSPSPWESSVVGDGMGFSGWKHAVSY